MSDKDENVIGVDVGWSLTGIKARLKSRLLGSVDQSLADKMARANVEDRRVVASETEREKARSALLDAAVVSLADQLRNDPTAASAFLNRAIPDLIERRVNYETVVEQAAAEIEQLTPPETTDYNTEQPDHLSGDFMSRFRSFAERASEEAVRQRWAKVLATEVAQPGTFSPKVLRAIDEIDPEVAAAFSRFATHRVVTLVPRALTLGCANYIEAFAEEGLISVTGGGHSIQTQIVNIEGAAYFLFNIDAFLIAIDTQAPIEAASDVALLAKGLKQPRIPVYKLTQLGIALASLSDHSPSQSAIKLALEFARRSPSGAALIGEVNGGDHVEFRLISPRDQSA